MRKILLPIIVFLFVHMAYAQPPSDGYYLDGIDDFINVPFTTNINSTVTNNRTYETYFRVTATSARQIIFKEGAGTRAVFAYVENGYLIMGAYNRADYNPRWEGTFYRKAITANTWYHFALVFDNAQPGNASTNPMTATANTALKWYLDGVLQTELSGYQLGGHNSLRLGYKNEGLRFPTCGTWTNSGLSEYCFGTITNDGGGNEYYMQGNIWGFRVWNDVRTPAEIDANKDVLINTVGTDDLVAALDGDTLTYLNSGNNAVDVSGSNVTSKTWSSTAATTDWFTGANWNGGVAPVNDDLESVIIPNSTNYPEINSHVKVGRVDIRSGSEVTINAGGTFDAYYELENDGTVSVENNGSLIYRENRPVSGTGSFVVKRDSPDYTNRYFYSYWSTPVEEADSNIATIFPNVGGYDYYWNAAAANAFWSNDHTQMEVGRGYAFRANHFNVETADFVGTVNNGDINESVYFTVYPDTGESGFNIIGNPYPSAITWEAFQADNSNVLDGTMYYWRQTEAPTGDNLASDYIEYNSTGSNPLGAATGNISTAQGFAVQAKVGGTITFKNSHRTVANNTQFFRTATLPESSANQTDGRLSLRISGNNLYATQLLGFIPEGTPNYDNRFDGGFINEGASIEFYSYLNDQKLSIQALPELYADDVEVPLGYQVTLGGNYTISIDAEYLSTDFDIILEDRYEGIFTNLRETSYTYTTGVVEENNRFFLRVERQTPLSIEDIQAANEGVNVFFKGNELTTVTTLTDIKTIELYDIAGKQLSGNSFKEMISIPGISTGVYIVKFTTEKGIIISKKILKP